jgi:hypothetical protein
LAGTESDGPGLSVGDSETAAEWCRSDYDFIAALNRAMARTQEGVAEPSVIVLTGFRLRSDVKILRWPDRYKDGRGEEFSGRVVSFLQAESKADLPSEPRTIPEPSDAAESARFLRVLAIA